MSMVVDTIKYRAGPQTSQREVDLQQVLPGRQRSSVQREEDANPLQAPVSQGVDGGLNIAA